MIEWVLFYRGVPISIEVRPEGETPTTDKADMEYILRNPEDENHNPRTRPAKPDFVNKDIFLFEMFTVPEQLDLQQRVETIDANADWDNNSPEQTAIYYRGLKLAQRQLENISRVEIASDRTQSFIDLIFALGVFGVTSDPAAQQAYATRKSMINSARLPDGRYINEDKKTGKVTFD